MKIYDKDGNLIVNTPAPPDDTPTPVPDVSAYPNLTKEKLEEAIRLAFEKHPFSLLPGMRGEGWEGRFEQALKDWMTNHQGPDAVHSEHNRSAHHFRRNEYVQREHLPRQYRHISHIWPEDPPDLFRREMTRDQFYLQYGMQIKDPYQPGMVLDSDFSRMVPYDKLPELSQHVEQHRQPTRRELRRIQRNFQRKQRRK